MTTKTKEKPDRSREREPTAPAPNAVMINRREAAFVLGVSVETIDEMVSGEKIPSRVIAGKRLFDRRELDSWMDAGSPPLRVWNVRRRAGTHRMATVRD